MSSMIRQSRRPCNCVICWVHVSPLRAGAPRNWHEKQCHVCEPRIAMMISLSGFPPARSRIACFLERQRRFAGELTHKCARFGKRASSASCRAHPLAIAHRRRNCRVFDEPSLRYGFDGGLLVYGDHVLSFVDARRGVQSLCCHTSPPRHNHTDTYAVWFRGVLTDCTMWYQRSTPFTI